VESWRSATKKNSSTRNCHTPVKKSVERETIIGKGGWRRWRKILTFIHNILLIFFTNFYSTYIEYVVTGKVHLSPDLTNVCKKFKLCSNKVIKAEVVTEKVKELLNN
jgi:hypothetical protein